MAAIPPVNRGDNVGFISGACGSFKCFLAVIRGDGNKKHFSWD